MRRLRRIALSPRMSMLCALTPGLFACAGGGHAAPPSANIAGGGALSAPAGTKLVRDDGGSDLSLGTNGAASFSTPVGSGGAYRVTFLTPPSHPRQPCPQTRDTRTATANLTGVSANCGHGEWTWMGGSNVADKPGIYGTLGTPSAANVPGARRGAVAWRDSAGNVWLFGGFGYDSAGTAGQLNDLWRYGAGEWTWMGGSDRANQTGTYGTLGKPSAANIPGARGQAVARTDASGNLWLFGGHGYDSNGAEGNLSDLWRYSAGQWTWMGGSDLDNQVGNYGTQGTPDPGNFPGARQQAVAWIDAAGNFWLFGGDTYDQAGMLYELNDLWKYGQGKWTWMGGSDLSNQDGIYGTLGTPSATNAPGARFAAVTWTDASDNVWLFGGGGYDSVGTDGVLNDLWRYSRGQWTWMGGSNLANQTGTYGTPGRPARANIPGARGQAVAWTDASGNFWLFGGEGYHSAGTIGYLNDLWEYRGGEWTWMGGPDSPNQPGTYGTLGTPAPGNVPPARFFRPVAWTDASGNLWLFGGAGYDSTGRLDLLNDLWRYEP
ncbi:MAG TPA: hypothetical protein VMD56_04600 [Steroidobacteraceae bacterium]|nr:hypothetical protein [Steroidobacteraceae bacterium]